MGGELPIYSQTSMVQPFNGYVIIYPLVFNVSFSKVAPGKRAGNITGILPFKWGWNYDPSWHITFRIMFDSTHSFVGLYNTAVENCIYYMMINPAYKQHSY